MAETNSAHYSSMTILCLCREQHHWKLISGYALPHAVRKDFFLGADPSREFEIGWIGQTSGEFYKTRAQWLPKLAQEFHTNDWSLWYSVAEVANVYRRSQIVVNIGRDDFPQDANLRVFEVLASGTLLLTAMPTELTQLGFQQGTHFVGYCDPAEINSLARKYLQDEPARARSPRPRGLLSWRNIPTVSNWTSF
jgi:spore maturation protein CgeB